MDWLWEVDPCQLALASNDKSEIEALFINNG
jgi:hypothetical protein